MNDEEKKIARGFAKSISTVLKIPLREVSFETEWRKNGPRERNRMAAHNYLNFVCHVDFLRSAWG